MYATILVHGRGGVSRTDGRGVFGSVTVDAAVQGGRGGAFQAAAAVSIRTTTVGCENKKSRIGTTMKVPFRYPALCVNPSIL